LNNDVIVTTGWLGRMLRALNPEGTPVGNAVPGVPTNGIRPNSGSDAAADGAAPANEQGASPGTGERLHGTAGRTEKGKRRGGEEGKGDEVQAAAAAFNPQSAIRDPQFPVGLVGPCSNAVSGDQLVEVGYNHLADLDGWAWDWGRKHDGQRLAVERLVGFCLLFRRELIGRIDLLDERFGIGNYEDDDYCLRAKQAGCGSVIARDAFVHHFGHRTFIGSGTDLNALLERNQRLFQEKWGRVEGTGDRLQGTAGSGAASAANPQSAIRDPKSPPYPLSPVTCPLISCCMITRNNERTIAAAVESIKPFVGEVIVADTGSTDRTVEICLAQGCRVYQFKWCDDFSAARNESLKYARGRWIIWIDSDDVIDPENGRGLVQLLMGVTDPRMMGFTMKVRCPAADEGDVNFTVVDHLKVFRNRPDLRFEGRIHEQAIESINRLNGNIAFTPLFVVHAGADHTPEGRRRKLHRDIRLLHLDRRERPNHPFVHFNFGMTYADMGKHRKAIKSLRRSLELAQPTESHVRKVYALLAGCHKDLGERAAGLAVCREGLALFPKDPELHFRHAVLLQDDGRLRQAELANRAALANDDAPHLASFDQGIVGHKCRQNLAALYFEMGAVHKAEAEWRQIVADVPGYRPGWEGLLELLLLQGKLDEARELPQRLLSQQTALAGTAVTLASRVAAAVGNVGTARWILETGVRECPADHAPLEALCELLFLHDQPAEAEGPLQELVRRRPANPGAWHNLGTVSMRLGRIEQAIEAFQTSLKHRPDAPLTHLSLGYALATAGRRAEAAKAFQACMRLALGEPAAEEAARQLAALRAQGT
jgi:tetratricopeptide (TPR) repeat protein/GT2 family glycosyltransferase